MNITVFLKQLPILLKNKTTALLVARHGVGKSSIIEQFAKDEGHFCVVQNLGTKETGDVQGLLDIKDGISTFLPPKFVAELNDFARKNPDKYAICFLDEINHIHKDMQSVLFSALLGNRIGDVQMEHNVRYVAAMNPPTKEYPGVFDFRNLALVDRFCHIELSPTTAEWAAFAKAQNIKSDLIDFFIVSPNLLTPVSAEAYNVHKNIKGSPRSAILAARLEADGANEEVLEGVIGTAALQSYIVWKKKRDEDSLKVTDILGRKSLLKKSRETLQRWTKDEEYGKINTLCEELKAHFNAMEPGTGTKEDARRLQDLLELIPIDKAYEMVLTLTRDTQSINMRFDSAEFPEARVFWEAVIKSGKVVPNGK